MVPQYCICVEINKYFSEVPIQRFSSKSSQIISPQSVIVLSNNKSALRLNCHFIEHSCWLVCLFPSLTMCLFIPKHFHRDDLGSHLVHDTDGFLVFPSSRLQRLLHLWALSLLLIQCPRHETELVRDTYLAHRPIVAFIGHPMLLCISQTRRMPLPRDDEHPKT